MSQKVIAVLDADIFCYKIACAATKEIMFDEYAISVGDSAEAKQALDNWIDSVVERVGADRIELAFTGPNNFRKTLYPDYKGNRVNKSVPQLFKELKDYSKTAYKVLEEEGLEADDIIGKRMSWSYLNPDMPKFYMGVSEDKDLLTIPGKLYNPGRGEITNISFVDAVHKFYIQTLTGDSTDNYKGCIGVGETKAGKAIYQALQESMHNKHVEVEEFIDKGWEAVLKLYDKACMDKCDAEMNATMAKILWIYEKPGEMFHPDQLKKFWRIKNGSEPVRKDS